ncbi:MAG: hypothetical protein IJ300_09540, partial [Clostridia bacterium]|nr:hypothetical protein [Clostridia bacterium]
NTVTTLTQSSYTGDIEISGTSYYDAYGSIDGLLGREIYYVVSHKDSGDVLYYWENVKANKILTLKSSDVRSVAGGSITYYKGDRTANAHISGELNVILNGVAYNSWTEADFMADEAEITLIDRQKDGVFETAMIEKPQVIVVRTAASEDNKLTIKGKNKLVVPAESGDGEELVDSELILSDFDKLTVYKNGRASTPDSAEENNLIMAYVSEDKKVVRLEILTNSVSGLVSGSTAEGLKIDDIEYLYSDYYKNNASQSSYVGKECTFILNKFDEIIYVEQSGELESETQKLGFIAAVNVDPSLDAPRFKIFVKDGVIKQEWYRLDNSRSYYIDVVASGMKFYDCATKVIIDGVSKSHADITNIINSTPRQLLYRMVLFKTDSNGNLKQLIIDSTNEDAELQKMSVTLDGGKDVFMVGLEGIFRYNQMIMPLNAESPVFTIPTVDGVPVSGGAYDDYYSISTARSVYGNYALITSYPTFYQPDEFGYPAFSVRLKDISEIAGSVLSPINNDASASVLVSGVSQIVEDDEVCYAITGINISTGAEEEIRFTSEVERIYDGFKITTENSSLLNTNSGYANRLTGENLNTYTVAIGDLKSGDLIRYTNAGSLDGNHAAQVERVFTYNPAAPLESYTAIKGSLRSMSTGGSDYPASKFRMTYGTAGLYNGEKLTLNILSDQANKEVINLASVYKFYSCDGKYITPMTRYNFTDCITDTTKILTVVSNYGYVALIAYQY